MEMSTNDSNEAITYTASSESTDALTAPKVFKGSTHHKFLSDVDLKNGYGKRLSSLSSGILEKKKHSLQDYELNAEIGWGAYAKVFLGKCKFNEEKVAIKILEKEFINRFHKADEALIEREILKHVDHPNIIKLFSTFQTKESLYYVLEYAPYRDLDTLLRTQGVLSYELSQFYAAEIVNVLEYLHHEKKIAHRDLKPGNLVLDGNMHLKLIDFSTATVLGKFFDRKTGKFITDERSQEYSCEIIGTAEYISPEMLSHKVTNCCTTDLWALGCIIYQFFHSKTPFKGANDFQTFGKIQAGKYAIKSDIPDDAKDIISKLLIPDPTTRIEALGIGGELNYQFLKSHPFFKGINFETLHAQTVPISGNYLKTIKSRTSLADSIISVEASDESFESCNISCQNFSKDTDSPTKMQLWKESPDCNQCSECEFSIEYFLDESPAIIEDYLEVKIEEYEKLKSPEILVVIEGLVKTDTLWGSYRKLRLFYSNRFEIWNHRKNKLLVFKKNKYLVVLSVKFSFPGTLAWGYISYRERETKILL